MIVIAFLQCSIRLLYEIDSSGQSLICFKKIIHEAIDPDASKIPITVTSFPYDSIGGILKRFQTFLASYIMIFILIKIDLIKVVLIHYSNSFIIQYITRIYKLITTKIII